VKWVVLLFWYSLFKKKRVEDWDALAGSYIDKYKMPQGIIIVWLPFFSLPLTL
jgi:hypothetical protein